MAWTTPTLVEICVGLEINANHISPCREGVVTGVASPLHLGGTTQVWEIRISQGDRLVCVRLQQMYQADVFVPNAELAITRAEADGPLYERDRFLYRPGVELALAEGV